MHPARGVAVQFVEYAGGTTFSLRLIHALADFQRARKRMVLRTRGSLYSRLFGDRRNRTDGGGIHHDDLARRATAIEPFTVISGMRWFSSLPRTR